MSGGWSPPGPPIWAWHPTISKTVPEKFVVQQSIPVQMPANLLCTYCQKKQASVFCTCFGTTTLLCIQDISQHYEKCCSAIAHPILPIAALKDFSSVSDPGYYDGFQQRSTAFSQGKQELRANLELMDKCCQDTEKAIGELITSLTKFKDEIINQVKGYKRKLEADIAKAEEEVQATLSQKSPTLTTLLAQALRDFKAGGLKLFTYQVNAGALEQMIPQTVNCQVFEPDGNQLSIQVELPRVAEVMRQIPCSNCGREGLFACVVCSFSACSDCFPCPNCRSQGSLARNSQS